MTSPSSPRVHVTRATCAPSAAYLAMVAPLLIDSSSGCACTRSRRRAGRSFMGPPYEQAAPPAERPAVPGRPARTRQNLIPPIMPATFDVTSEMVGAIDELAM